MQFLPILHAAQAVSQGGSPALPALAILAGLAGTALTIAVLWLRDLARRPTARKRALLLVASLLTVAALTPSILPFDHLWMNSAHADEHSPVHTWHCHDAPGACSDAPVTTGPGQLMNAAPLIVLPAMLALLLATTLGSLTSISMRPELRPPMPRLTV